jgi:GntR family transcriptional regulator of arabinose operon
MNKYKYLSIVQWAKDTVEEKGMGAGERFFSEAELCAIHNVSRQTVRQALAVLEKQGVLFRKRGSGTYIKSTWRNKKKQSVIVGVVSTYFSDYIFPSIVTGIERVLIKNNMSMQLAITHNMVSEEARTLHTMLNQNVAGLIVEPSKSALPNPNITLYDEIRNRGIPLVFFNAKYPWAEFPYVAMDDIAAGYIVTKHLISIGHSKITGIFACDDIQGHKRYEGFMKSFEECNIHDAEQRVFWYSTNEKATMFTLSKERIESLLEVSTAVVCYNDNLAVSLLEFCKARGYKVPEDISIVGIDDSKLARICEPLLTTVRHPQQKLGEATAVVLIKMLEKPAVDAKDNIFVPHLVERLSTKPLETQK